MKGSIFPKAASLGQHPEAPQSRQESEVVKARSRQTRTADSIEGEIVKVWAKPGAAKVKSKKCTVLMSDALLVDMRRRI